MSLKNKQKVIIFIEVIVFFVLCFLVYSFFDTPLPSETLRDVMMEQQNLRVGNGGK